MRPYLGLALTGPNGTPINVVGLLDTGADISSLPLGFAVLMGYTPATLTQSNVTIASGATVPVHRPSTPCDASLEPTAVTMQLTPTFMIGATVNNILWGRRDVMAAFASVAFRESEAKFVLEW